MSDESVEVARRLFEEASRVRDPSGRTVNALDPETLEVVYDFFAPDVELHEDPNFPEGGLYRGLDAVRGYFAQFTESFDEFTFEAEDFVDLGEDKVLFLFRLRTRGTGSGAPVEVHPGWIYTIRDRKIVRAEAYLDRNQALAAAGLADRSGRPRR